MHSELAAYAEGTSVNLQVTRLEQRMTGIGWGVTKEGRTYYIYVYIAFMQCSTIYVGLAQAP